MTTAATAGSKPQLRWKIPIKKITVLFIFTKLLLLLILLIVPLQYDTSSLVLLAPPREDAGFGYKVLSRLVSRLVIWDSVYFTTIAQRGVLYEHEWAFGRLWTLIIQWLTPGFLTNWPDSPVDPLYYYGITSILIANLSHYLGAIMLFVTTRTVFGKDRTDKFALVTSLFYVISPAGIFLTAGYAEPLFALLSFIGIYLRQKQAFLMSGLFFAACTGLRSNGLLWGLVFLFDLAVAAKSLQILKSIRIIVGGILIGASFASVQIYAYLQYCPERGEWCEWMVPSIYSFVQSHYWNVGFLRYWTPNNIPNFLFATPVFIILWKSGCYYGHSHPYAGIQPYLLVQFVVFVSALLVWHVQIINRLSTCLPAMYWFAAEMLTSTHLDNIKTARKIVSYCIIWILAQAVLFTAFLPPA